MMTREQKKHVVRNLQVFFDEERDEQIGELAAEQLIDFLLKELQPFVYNQAIADARKMVLEKMSQLEDELFMMEKVVEK